MVCAKQSAVGKSVARITPTDGVVPRQNWTICAHWSGYIKSFYGTKPWHAVFDGSSYTSALSLDRLLKSVVVSGCFHPPVYILKSYFNTTQLRC